MLHRASASVRATVLPTLSRTLARGLATATDEKLEKTALYDLHLKLGGKMVPFAGYSLPVQYPDGVLKSHLHTRAADSASLFDVGHMGQLLWRGKDRAKFLERVLVGDVQALGEGNAMLSLVTNTKGGILDDTVVSNHGNLIYMVVNGATKHKDMKHFDEQLSAYKAANPGADVSYEYLHTQNLVALQGTAAPAILAKLVPADMADRVQKMAFMSGVRTTVAGVPCTVTRCGYTGEDGYEIGMAAEHAVKVAEALLADKRALPAGLGPRDSLRLEAGLCLYGHDIDEVTTPNEAALTWTIGKSRRAAGGFLGADVILKELKEKSWKKRRVGLNVLGAPAREGAKIYTAPASGSSNPGDATQVGVVTSGTFSPCLKAPIAMGYVATPHSADGSKLTVEVRGKLIPAVVTKMPWVPHRYYKPAKA